ncbi:MAG: hypothetical protein CR989_03370 [Flavobacteriales bacterium]|nr:MAG: hypothetical protein CR989_03370 [Flavobacteriales bacterium]
MKTIYAGIIIIFTITLLFTNCSKDNDAPETEKVTYNNKIKDIIDANCISCHASPPQNGAPFSLTTYADVKDKSAEILNAVKTGKMPPYGELSQTTIDAIQQWIDDGKLEK